jgi:MFS family permease
MQGRRAIGDEWWRPTPQGASTDAIRVLAARGVRAFGDGFVALLLPIYLVDLGFSAFAIGAIVCATLVGTALLTLWVGIIANRHSRRHLLLVASLLMAMTGLGFAATTGFWPLLVIAFVGTMNPTSGDASVFLPLEQTVLTQTVEPRRRTALFARYSVIGSVAGALGILAAAAPDLAANWAGCTRATVTQLMFGFYGMLGIVALRLSGHSRRPSREPSRLPRRRCISRAGSSTGWRHYSAWIRSAPGFWFSRCSRSGSTKPSPSR